MSNSSDRRWWLILAALVLVGVSAVSWNAAKGTQALAELTRQAEQHGVALSSQSRSGSFGTA
ncbi:MAG TPA: hypothetical protein VMF89_01260, partial [Polyangiales bacterium]|nr:hypothetical protein [Polyangiales bacterium]